MATWRYKNPPAPARLSQFLCAASERGEREMEGQHDGDGGGVAAEADIERLPADLLAHVLFLLPSFRDLSMAGGVSRRWRLAVEQSLASRRRLSFAGQRTGDDTAARLVRAAVNIRDLDICWGCQITDEGLIKISSADCVGNLTSISLWGLAGITDKGVVHLVSRAYSLKHLNIGGTFITDESLYAVANSCTNLKLPCAEHNPVELPVRDRGRAGGAGEQVPEAGVHQRRRDAGATGELRRPALHQPRPADQVHPADPQRQCASLMKQKDYQSLPWFTGNCMERTLALIKGYSRRE
ncbi:F-box protein At5g67140 isoform X2 [Phragmites australis]|uniref:F-box protein At5g67140 isoform X2 n=1 Tax=Phragmites australis TaxID=29695 RepID=UPI002D791A9C|nr:F-box protein At5g67140 isoform X2 [Phragmites australis]